MVSMTDRSEVLDALVIGGSQAGLAIGYHLADSKRDPQGIVPASSSTKNSR